MNNFKIYFLFFTMVLAVVVASRIKTVDKKMWTMSIIRINNSQTESFKKNPDYNQKIKLPVRKSFYE